MTMIHKINLIIKIVYSKYNFIMPNLLIFNSLYRHVATYYNKLKKTISKLHKSLSSVAF